MSAREGEVSAADVLAALTEGPTLWAVVDAEGRLSHASSELLRVFGIAAGDPAPDGLRLSPPDDQIFVADRTYDVTERALASSSSSSSSSAGSGRLIVLEDRTEVVKMDEQIWERQTLLSRVYSQLSVRNQALAEREAELSLMNRTLEEKVREQIRDLERANRFRRYLSPEVATAVLAGEQHELTTHKILVTVFFAEIAGFDDLVGEMESEEVIEVLNDYRRETTRILFAHGGTLDKFVTARLMGFFGDPVAQEDHAARAVRAALDMRDAVRTMRAKWFPGAAADLQVGIHTGYSTVGNVGSENCVDYTVIGKNASLASAIEQEARPSQILVSARTAEALRDAFEIEPLQIRPKTGSRAISVFSVIGAIQEAPESSAPTIAAVRGAMTKDAPGRLGPYQLREKLGAGAMGVVFKGFDERLQRVVAIKVLSAELASDTTFVARFKKEARALASLNSPHIAQIYFISDAEHPPFFAMEYVDGPTLRRVLANEGRLPERRVIELTIQVARGLQTAAELGVIHRDIKPDNIMLTSRGQAKLTDFGLVKDQSTDQTLTVAGTSIGTPMYMSPEAVTVEQTDLRSDIYSLGATCFHLVFGTPPFDGENTFVVMRKHIEADLPALLTLPGGVTPAVFAVLQKMMAKRPQDRFSTYDELIAALSAL